MEFDVNPLKEQIAKAQEAFETHFKVTLVNDTTTKRPIKGEIVSMTVTMVAAAENPAAEDPKTVLEAAVAASSLVALELAANAITFAQANPEASEADFIANGSTRGSKRILFPSGVVYADVTVDLGENFK